MRQVAQAATEKQQQVKDLKARVVSLTTLVDSPASPASPAFIQASLEEGQERIKYTQRSVDDRLHDLAMNEARLAAAVGPKGSVVGSIERLSRRCAASSFNFAGWFRSQAEATRA
jgi:hypothetical protein